MPADSEPRPACSSVHVKDVDSGRLLKPQADRPGHLHTRINWESSTSRSFDLSDLATCHQNDVAPTRLPEPRIGLFPIKYAVACDRCRWPSGMVAHYRLSDPSENRTEA